MLNLREMNRKNLRIKSLKDNKLKEQSAGIVSQKVNEICRLIPAFEREIIWSNRGQTGTERTKQTKDSVAFSFRNGSVLENVAASEHTRGRRFHSGLMEECVGIDDTMLNEVLIPEKFGAHQSDLMLQTA